MIKTTSGYIPYWQVPIILIALANYVELWKFWQVRQRINRTIAIRKSCYIIPKDHKPTFSELLSFGHWVVSAKLISMWDYKSNWK